MAQNTTTHIHFIPNSHLDREWTMDFQHTRLLTVTFIDALLDIMERIPEYRFLLDGQAVPLEDYLEIRPERRNDLERLIRAGRLQAGPWYTALDMHCISGESIVRNMLKGHRLVESFGPPMKIGYTPFGWGQISQLPQIYLGFGIDMCFFYRGVSKAQCPQAEFLWTGADGSEILCSRFGTKARYNFYFDVWRESLYAGRTQRLDRFCEWRTETPFKLCDEGNRFDHGTLLNAERTLDDGVLARSFRKLLDAEKEAYSTPEIAFMHGMDTSMPDAMEGDVVQRCRKHLHDGETLFFSSLPRYADAVKECVDRATLARFSGEVKHFVVGDGRYRDIANDIISARMPQKMLTTEAETLLSRYAEPAAMAAAMLGAPWPTAYLDAAWAYYLRCLPHDTIAGCSIDEVELDARHRLRQVTSLARMILKESLAFVQAQADTPAAGDRSMALTVFNPSTFTRSERATAYMDWPRAWGAPKPELIDSDGVPVPCAWRATGHEGKIFRDRADVALYADGRELAIEFHATDVPGLGYRTYALRPATGGATQEEAPIATDDFVLENECLRAQVNADGTVDVLHKATGRTYYRLNSFLDDGEVGQAWTHVEPAEDEVCSTTGKIADRRCVANSAVSATVRASLRLDVPATTYLEHRGSRRSRRRRKLNIDVSYTLAAHSPSLAVEVRVDNTCTNHRLRVSVPTGIEADTVFAETPFDVVERPVSRAADANPYHYFIHHTYNFLRFVGMTDKAEGLAIVAQGLREYEVTEGREFLLTLFRAFELQMCTTSTQYWETRPDGLNQCPGEMTFRYELLPFAGDWSVDAMNRAADRCNVPLLVCESAPHAGALPSACTFLSQQSGRLVVSGLKKAERSDAWVLRCYNPSQRRASDTFTFRAPIRSARVVDLNELPVPNATCGVQEHTVTLEAEPKKIVTALVEFGQRDTNT